VNSNNDAAIQSLSASGFPFQTAVAHAVALVPGWTLQYQEYPWRDESGSDRFLDIVAIKGNMTATIECKKTRKEVFTFLNPGKGQNDVRACLCPFAGQVKDSTRKMQLYCGRFEAQPVSFEASFCVVSTSESGKDQRLLERDAQLLIRGTHALGKEYVRKNKHLSTLEPDRPYIPVIVTNARLLIASYDPADISFETGEFKTMPDSSQLEPINWIRFVKSFTSHPDLDPSIHTVFIVSAHALCQFLTELEADPKGADEQGRSVLIRVI